MSYLLNRIAQRIAQIGWKKFWLDRHLNLISVKDDHSELAQDIKGQNKKMKSLFEKGLIRIVIYPPKGSKQSELLFDWLPTTKQMSFIKNYAFEHNLLLIDGNRNIKAQKLG